MEMTWADRIRKLEALGWTLTALGEAIGLSSQGVSDIKQGRTKAPTGMAAVRLHDLHARLGEPGTFVMRPSEEHGEHFAATTRDAVAAQRAEAEMGSVHGADAAPDRDLAA